MFALFFLAFATQSHLRRSSAAARAVSLCTSSAATCMRSTSLSFTGPVSPCDNEPGHVFPYFVRRGVTTYKFPVLNLYTTQPTRPRQVQSIVHAHTTAASARTGLLRATNMIPRIPTRRTLSITPGGSVRRTPRPQSIIRGVKAGMGLDRLIDHSQARSRKCIMTITQWSARAAHRKMSRSAPTLPLSSTSTVAFALYANTRMEGAACAERANYKVGDIPTTSA